MRGNPLSLRRSLSSSTFFVSRLLGIVGIMEMWMRGVGDGRQNEQAHINLGESHTRRRGHERGMMGRDGAVMGP
jgi:hypothetical protein